MKGYKVFNSNLTCRGYQFEVGKEYKHKGALIICNSGFHFCLKAADCFSYYGFDSKNIVCEVEALGITVTHESDSKIATDHIRIVKQLTWQEVLTVCNEGKDNTGLSNTGDRNTGGWNTGDRNTGGWNTGDRNTGYSNTGDRNTGVFCTGAEKYLPFFNKPSKWTEEKFQQSRAYELLCRVDTKMWVQESQMTDEEKKKYPSYKTAEGYLKDIPFKDAFQNAWHNWSEENRSAFLNLPNFDEKIFFNITGVKVEP